MKERRSLIEGLKPDPELHKVEEAFVFGAKRKPELVNELPIAEPIIVPAPVAVELPRPQPDRSILPQMAGRVPVTTRCRPEVASSLKRASLQRQLAGSEPFYVQDIMEEALETWLREKGYI